MKIRFSVIMLALCCNIAFSESIAVKNIEPKVMTEKNTTAQSGTNLLNKAETEQKSEEKSTEDIQGEDKKWYQTGVFKCLMGAAVMVAVLAGIYYGKDDAIKLAKKTVKTAGSLKGKGLKAKKLVGGTVKAINASSTIKKQGLKSSKKLIKGSVAAKVAVKSNTARAVNDNFASIHGRKSSLDKVGTQFSKVPQLKKGWKTQKKWLGGSLATSTGLKANVAEAANDNIIPVQVKKSAFDKPGVQHKVKKLQRLSREGKLVVTKVHQRDSALIEKLRKEWENQHPGQSLKNIDMDHVHELQLGGKDSAKNIRPLDSTANRSIGAQINQVIQERGYVEGTPVKVQFNRVAN